MRRRLLRRVVTAACSLSLLAALPVLAPAAGASERTDRGDRAERAQQNHDRRGHHSSGLKRVGYFTQWGVYGRDFQVQDLVTSGTAARLTHLNYAFANVGPDGKCFEAATPGEGDPWADYQRPFSASDSVAGTADTATQPLAGNFNQLKQLKAKYPKLKTLISIGGWSWSTNFSDAALTPASRKAFVSSCIDLFIKGDLPLLDGRGGPGSAAGVFDGIDLDWEWPGSPGDVDTVYRPEDKENFTALVAEFRRQLDAYARSSAKDQGRHGSKKHYLLTAFLPAAPAAMDAGFEARKIFRDLDFGTLQGYDFHGSWDASTNQQSATRVPKGSPTAADDSSLQQVATDWLRRGAPARKLVVGMPFYGRGWTGVTGGGDGLFQPATGPAPATFEAGYEDYEKLKKLADSGTYKVHRDRRAGHAWLFDGTTFWTYDDPEVLRAKASWVRHHRLGGAMIWSLDGDTPDGELIKAIDRGLRR